MQGLGIMAFLVVGGLSVSAHAATNKWSVVDNSTVAFEFDTGERLAIEATCPEPNTPRYEFTHSIPTMGVEEAEPFIYAPGAIEKYNSSTIYRFVGTNRVFVYTSVAPEAQVEGMGADQVFVTRGYDPFREESGKSRVMEDILESDGALGIRYKETFGPTLYLREFPRGELESLVNQHLVPITKRC